MILAVNRNLKGEFAELLVALLPAAAGLHGGHENALGGHKRDLVAHVPVDHRRVHHQTYSCNTILQYSYGIN